MHAPSLAKRILPIGLGVVMAVTTSACGRKGDPVPRPRAKPGPCLVEVRTLRQLQVTLPRADVNGAGLVGLERVRVYHLPLGAAQPKAEEVLLRGEVVLERSRPDLPGPGESLLLDLSALRRPAGWLVVVAVRVGDVLGAPGPVVAWLDPAL